MNSVELRQKAAKLLAEMRGILDKAVEGKLPDDEQRAWDGKKAEYDGAIRQAEMLETQERLEADTARSAKPVIGAAGGKAPAEPAGDPLFGSKFGRWGLSISDIEWLYDVQEAAGRAGRSSGPTEELRNAFAALSKAYYMPMEEVRRIDRQAIDDLFPRIPLSEFRGRDRYWAQRGEFDRTSLYRRELRAMDTAESGYGNQLIGAQYVGDLWEAARQESRVASLIGSFEMTAPTAYLPVEVDFPAMLYVSESTSSSASNYTTSKTGSQRVSVSAKKFVIHQMWSGEMEEDSIIPYIPFLRGQAQRSLAFYQDDVALNGETTTTGINAVDSVESSEDATIAFDGIRHAGLVDNTANKSSAANAAPSLAHFRGAYGRMLDATYRHDWGHPNSGDDLIHVVDPYTGDAILDIDEFKTAQNAGNRATILAGELTRVYNHPVVSSIALKKTDTTGYYDADTAGNNLYGSIVTFNKNGFKWGWRRRVKMEVERIPATDQTRIVYSLRLGFGRFSPTGAASGIEAADVVYYLAV